MFRRIRQIFNPASKGVVICAWCSHADVNEIEPFRLDPNNIAYMCRNTKACNDRYWRKTL